MVAFVAALQMEVAIQWWLHTFTIFCHNWSDKVIWLLVLDLSVNPVLLQKWLGAICNYQTVVVRHLRVDVPLH